MTGRAGSESESALGWTETMKLQILIPVACLLLAVGALAVAVWTLVTGQVAKQGLDALFLILVCLLGAVMFLPFVAQAVRQGVFDDLLKRWKKRKNGPSV